MAEMTGTAPGQTGSIRARLSELHHRLPGKFTILLATILAFMLVPGLFENRGLDFVISVLLCGIVVATVNVVFQYDRPYQMIFACMLAVIAVGGWILDLDRTSGVIVTDLVCWALLMSFGVIVIVRRVLTAKRITYDTISAAACGYLLFAVMSAYIFTLLQFFYPGSFTEGGMPLVFRFDSPAHWEFRRMLYFSFVTVASLGYGDIVPHGAATMFAAVEGVTGQFYIAVLIARLVSLHASNWNAE